MGDRNSGNLRGYSWKEHGYQTVELGLEPRSLAADLACLRVQMLRPTLGEHCTELGGHTGGFWGMLSGPHSFLMLHFVPGELFTFETSPWHYRSSPFVLLLPCIPPNIAMQHPTPVMKQQIKDCVRQYANYKVYPV